GGLAAGDEPDSQQRRAREGVMTSQAATMRGHASASGVLARTAAAIRDVVADRDVDGEVADGAAVGHRLPGEGGPYAVVGGGGPGADHARAVDVVEREGGVGLGDEQGARRAAAGEIGG